MVKRLRWHNNLVDQINLLIYTVRGIKTSRGKTIMLPIKQMVRCKKLSFAMDVKNVYLSDNIG